MTQLLSRLKWPVAAGLAALAVAWTLRGAQAASMVAALIVLETSISFDNAVVNADVLRRLSDAWQRAFLTIGVVLAVFGMRVLFPIAVVAAATPLGLREVVRLSMYDQQAYAERVSAAVPLLGAFGGAFLLLVAFEFFLDPEREVHWLGPVERGMAWLGRLRTLPYALTGGTVLATSRWVAPEHERDVLLAGLLGMVVFQLVRGAATALRRIRGGQRQGRASGVAGLAGCVYLRHSTPRFRRTASSAPSPSLETCW